MYLLCLHKLLREPTQATKACTFSSVRLANASANLAIFHLRSFQSLRHRMAEWIATTANMKNRCRFSRRAASSRARFTQKKKKPGGNQGSGCFLSFDMLASIFCSCLEDQNFALLVQATHQLVGHAKTPMISMLTLWNSVLVDMSSCISWLTTQYQSSRGAGATRLLLLERVIQQPVARCRRVGASGRFDT